MSNMEYDHRVARWNGSCVPTKPQKIPKDFLITTIDHISYLVEVFGLGILPHQSKNWTMLTCTKAPIRYVDVPLCDYGDDGWDDSAKFLGVHFSEYDLN